VKEPSIVPVDQLTQEPYTSVLCFPKPCEAELQRRIQELLTLSVTALEFSGKTSLFGVGLPVLGKGFVGIVVVARMNGERIAIKIRRTDANRDNLLQEAHLLSIANSVEVAPKLINASKNFLLMQFIDGELLPNWLSTNKEEATVKRVLRQVLKQCFRLDQIGLDHGELSKAPKHILVDKAQKPFIVDFETASVGRRAANVTALCQYLFAGNSSASRVLTEILGKKERLSLFDALKAYKKDSTKGNFDYLLKVCLS
jgi:putative serine/threonine protein kinase